MREAQLDRTNKKGERSVVSMSAGNCHRRRPGSIDVGGCLLGYINITDKSAHILKGTNYESVRRGAGMAC